MSRIRPSLLAATALILAWACFAGPARAYSTVFAGVDCGDSTNVVVQWTFMFDPDAPAPPPEWVGWDVVRRTSACGTWERANAEPFPHAIGVTESFTFNEPPPATHAVLEYRLIMVDAQRQQVFPLPEQCLDCDPQLVTMCPALSAPLTHGTVEDWGWAVLIQPCPGSCYGAFYVENPAADPLRAYAGTGDAVRLYGTPACGTVEGCTMQLDHFDVAPCDVVPAVPSTWGRLKTRYR